MAKRKKSSVKKTRSKKAGGTKTRSRSAPAVLPEASQLFTGTGSALTPAPALPVAERGSRGTTRGGKSTVSTHEFLTEVPSPGRSKPPAPQAKQAAPQAKPAMPPAKPAVPPAKSAQPSARPVRPAPRPAPNQALSLSQIYETLAALLVPYARKMESEMHPKIGFCLKAKSARTGRETHFGAVQALPDGVAYHLFPLYGHKDLLENVSPELMNCMRGMTCFHFESLHAGLVAELAELTHAGFERFLSDGVF